MDRQTVFFIILVLIILVTGYTWYSYFGSVVVVEEGLGEVKTENIEMRLSELKKLNDLQLDTALFGEQSFKELDFPVVPKPPEVKVGRPNPFLPF